MDPRIKNKPDRQLEELAEASAPAPATEPALETEQPATNSADPDIYSKLADLDSEDCNGVYNKVEDLDLPDFILKDFNDQFKYDPADLGKIFLSESEPDEPAPLIYTPKLQRIYNKHLTDKKSSE